MSKASLQASAFLAAASRNGFSVQIKGSSVVCIERQFEPGDRNAYVACDMMGPDVLDLAPLRGGSVWGSDGASVGGMVALHSGRYSLNKSGNGSAFMRALAAKIGGVP